MTKSALTFTRQDPLVVAALHLPDFTTCRDVSVNEIEDFALRNTENFVKGGIRRIMLQDQTRQVGPASAQTIAITTAVARSMKRAFPEISLGIIVQAHDAVAPLAIARAAGADFVRLKVFVGASMTFEGPREALAVTATTYRHQIGAQDIAIMADVFDRTSRPMIDVPPADAAVAAQKYSADALVITGDSFAESCARVQAAKAAGVTRPILIGGSVDIDNITAALDVADGVVVSTSLMSQKGGMNAIWDRHLTAQLMAKVAAR